MKNKDHKLLMLNFIVSLFLFASILVLFIIIYYQSSSLDLMKPYYIGGILSGVFSGLAFIGVLATLLFQMQESKKQKKINDIQRFETTLFNMLNLQQEIVKGLSFSYHQKQKMKFGLLERFFKENNKEEINGRQLFRFLYVEYEFMYTEDKYYTGLFDFLDNNGLDSWHTITFQYQFDHYFRHLYRIIKYIDSRPFLLRKDKYDYTSIVRATLSRFELIWLFYNCLSPSGINFKPLVESYALFNNLRKEALVDQIEHVKLYNLGAYEFIE